MLPPFSQFSSSPTSVLFINHVDVSSSHNIQVLVGIDHNASQLVWDNGNNKDVRKMWGDLSVGRYANVVLFCCLFFLFYFSIFIFLFFLCIVVLCLFVYRHCLFEGFMFVYHHCCLGVLCIVMLFFFKCHHFVVVLDISSCLCFIMMWYMFLFIATLQNQTTNRITTFFKNSV